MASYSWQSVARMLRFRVFEAPCSQHYSVQDPDNCAHCADNRAVAVYDDKVAGNSELSWERVAIELSRVLDASHCEDHARIKKDCPFCDDVKAYQTFIRKASSSGYTIVDPFANTVAVPVHEVKRNPSLIAES